MYRVEVIWHGEGQDGQEWTLVQRDGALYLLEAVPSEEVDHYRRIFPDLALTPAAP